MSDHPKAPDETRTVTADLRDVRTEGRTLTGHACLYGHESRDLGGYRETIQVGAFTDVLASDPDVYLSVNHSADRVLARTRSGTLRLRDEQRGLAFEADLGDGPTAQDVREQVRRGDISGASFRFTVAPGGDRWEGERRTLTRIGELIDLSLATTPAYDGPRVELRSAPEPTTETTSAIADTTTAGESREEDTVRTEDRDTTPSGGGLAVEDRTAASEPTTETRVLDAIRSISKGESRALTTTSAAAIAPNELSRFVFDRLRPASVLLRSGVRVIPTDRDSIEFPRLTGDATPGFFNETAAITPSDPTIVTLTGVPRKIGALVQLSNEVVSDSDPAIVDVLNCHLATILATRLDLAGFEGSGAAPEIRGLKNVAGIQSISLGANGAAITNLDPISDALALLEGANAVAGAIVMPPRTWNVLRKLKDTTGRPLLGDGAASTTPSIFGVPVYVSSQLSIAEAQGTATTASSIYVYDPTQVVVVNRNDATIELDRSRLFNQDMSEMRGTLRADLLAPNPTAICRIAGVL
jgi:HK97 family phage major capsid protein/HK97 family phage prohead protease